MPQSGPGFPDPITALNAVVACLNMPANFVVHTGSFGSGETIPCCAQPCDGDGCQGGVLRIETGMTTPKLSTPTAMIMTGRCAQPLVQQIIITYRECFPSNLGKQATETHRLTAAGVSIVMSWWDALNRLWSCNTQAQQLLRFVSREDSSPLGQCAGWTMTLECDLINCIPAPVEGGAQVIAMPIGETNVTTS